MTDFEKLAALEVPLSVCNKRAAARQAKRAFSPDYVPVFLLVKRATDDDSDRPFTIAVDLDGTLAHKEEPFDPDSIGPPREEVVRWVRLFHEKGARIIIFTVRGDTEMVEAWLTEHDVPFDHINENPDQPEDSSGKVIADVYWDDKALSAEDPEETGPEILRRLNSHSGEDEAKDTGPTVVIDRTVIRITGPLLLEAMEDTDE